MPAGSRKKSRMRENGDPRYPFHSVAGGLEGKAASVWPAVFGSLSLRRAPCIRKNCEAYRLGEQHPSYVLYGKLKGRRFTMYISALV
jgi:hypothetical protein